MATSLQIAAANRVKEASTVEMARITEFMPMLEEQLVAAARQQMSQEPR
jgi:hypothetical protein